MNSKLPVCYFPICEESVEYVCRELKNYSCLSHSSQSLFQAKTTEKLIKLEQISIKFNIFEYELTKVLHYVKAYYNQELSVYIEATLKGYMEEFLKLKSEVDEVLQRGELYILIDIFRQMIELEMRFDKSEIYQQYTIYKCKTSSVNELQNVGITEKGLLEGLSMEEISEKTKTLHKDCIHKLYSTIKEQKINFKKEKDILLDRYEKEKNDQKKLIEKSSQKHQEDVQKISLLKKELKESKKKEGLSNSQFNTLFKFITDQISSMGPTFELKHNFTDEKHQEFVKLISQFKIPDCDRIDLDSVPGNERYIKKFLTYSFPKVKFFNFNDVNDSLTQIDSYIDEIGQANANVTEECCIFNYELTCTQIAKILNSTKHVLYSIGFAGCKLLTDKEPDFTQALKDFKCQSLSFDYSGNSDRSDWANYPKRFQNIIVALSKVSDVKETLEKIAMAECGMAKGDVRKILDDNGLNDVQIVHHSV